MRILYLERLFDLIRFSNTASSPNNMNGQTRWCSICQSIKETSRTLSYLLVINTEQKTPKQRNQAQRSKERHRSILQVSRMIPVKQPQEPENKRRNNNNEMIYRDSEKGNSLYSIQPPEEFSSITFGLKSPNSFGYPIDCVQGWAAGFPAPVEEMEGRSGDGATSTTGVIATVELVGGDWRHAVDRFGIVVVFLNIGRRYADGSGCYIVLIEFLELHILAWESG